MIRHAATILLLLLVGSCTLSTDAEPGDSATAAGDGDRRGDASFPGDTAGDAPPCARTGALGAACRSDCDCALGSACRGLPGEEICAIPCERWDACDGLDIGCAAPQCDAGIAACRCPCEAGGCGDDPCAAGWCVGCADDSHCATHPCGSEPGLDQPRCELAAAACTCGGDCGDGTCDAVEAAASSCPADCPGPCVPGETLAHSCTDGQRQTWCTCGGDDTWACADATDACFGDTACQRAGGQCVEQADYCYEGQIAADAQGCGGTAALCCEPLACTAAGGTYYPGNGICCPGLRALDSAMLMESFSTTVQGMLCFANCWAMTCAPCGDGTCQPHLTENPCNCPEDCPLPPIDLVCEYSASECGRSFCRQEGETCHQEIPTCVGQACTVTREDLPGLACDRVTDSCR